MLSQQPLNTSSRWTDVAKARGEQGSDPGVRQPLRVSPPPAPGLSLLPAGCRRLPRLSQQGGWQPVRDSSQSPLFTQLLPESAAQVAFGDWELLTLPFFFKIAIVIVVARRDLLVSQIISARINLERKKETMFEISGFKHAGSKHKGRGGLVPLRPWWSDFLHLEKAQRGQKTGPMWDHCELELSRGRGWATEASVHQPAGGCILQDG